LGELGEPEAVPAVATPQNPQQCLRMQVRRFWQRAQREQGTEEVQKVFQWMMDNLGFEEAHNVLGCSDCQWEG